MSTPTINPIPGSLDSPSLPPTENTGITFCLSGGKNNGNPALSLGGAISQVKPGMVSTYLNNILGNVWDFVPTSETVTGFGPEYRCLYIQNNTTNTLFNVKVWFDILNSDSDVSHFIGIGTSAENGIEQTIGAENISPSGVTFLQPTSKATGLLVAAVLPPGDWKAIWLARTTRKGAVPFYADNFQLRAEGEEGTPSLIVVNDWGFATAGGWSCNNQTAVVNIKNIANRLKNVPPMQLFIPLGELSMDVVGTCWYNMTSNLKSIIHMVFGDSEMSSLAIKNDYSHAYGINSTVRSFDYQNVHFLLLNTEIAYDTNSPQYQFALSDLTAKQTDSKIDWIIVAEHQPIYNAATSGNLDTGIFNNTRWRDIYHPVFQQLGVDIVLQNHHHSYQRTYPLNYNASTPTSPTILVSGTDNYVTPGGTIFLTVGTGGTTLDTNSMPSTLPSYLAFADTSDFGYMWITITQNGSLLTGTFFNLLNVAVDTFTITKIIQ